MCSTARLITGMSRNRAEYNEYMRKYMKERYAKRRAIAISMLGGRCVDCSSVEDLEFDHADRTTKSFDIGKRLAGCAEERLQDELAKIVLRCQPCHALKSILERGHMPVKGRDVHGTLSSYRYCKCVLCRAAKTAYVRSRRQDRGPEV